MSGDNRFGMCCNCPARMSDGRFLNNSLPTKTFEYLIRSTNNVPDGDHAYRRFLQENATKIMNQEMSYDNQYQNCSFNPITYQYRLNR